MGTQCLRRLFLPVIAALAATLACAAPAGAIIVKLPGGRYASYAALSGSRAPRAAQRFDAAFTNVDYSGGPVMPSNTNYPVFWEPSNYSGTAFQTGFTSGVEQFFTDLAATSGSSSVSDAVSAQYNDAAGQHASFQSSYGGALLDSDPLPADGCPAATGGVCITDAQIQTELNRFLAAHGLPHDLTHEYFLFTPPGIASCMDSSACSGNAVGAQAYCAYHSRSSAGYVYANIPDLVGLRGCDPFVTSCPVEYCHYDNGPADGVLSAVSHEHNESITDPEPNNAWTDWGSDVGGEIGDKCNDDGMDDPNAAWREDGYGDAQPYNQVLNGHDYLLQMEWSNQTAQCLDSAPTTGTSAEASFTSAPAGGDTVTFDAGASSASDGVADYVWQWNDGSCSAPQASTEETTSPVISHTFATGGIYTVALTVMAQDGTSAGTARQITVAPQPPEAVFTISRPSDLEGTPVSFDASASTDTNFCAAATGFSWNFGDGTSGSGVTTTHAFGAGAYTVTLTVTDSYGQRSTTSHPVVVDGEAPQAAFSVHSGHAGAALQFSGHGSDPDGSIVAYRWSFGDGRAGSGQDPFHTYRSRGVYRATLTVLDSSGERASVSHLVTIGAPACIVPGLRGRTLGDATSALRAAGCGLGQVKMPSRPPHGARRGRRWVLVVARQSANPGAVESVGHRVSLSLYYHTVRG